MPIIVRTYVKSDVATNGWLRSGLRFCPVSLAVLDEALEYLDKLRMELEQAIANEERVEIR